VAMHLIREKQKLIYWVVAILTIPTFIIFFGGGSGYLRSDPNAGLAVARVDGQNVSQSEFNQFRQQMRAVCSSLQFLPTYYYNGQYQPQAFQNDENGYYSSVLAMSCVREAEKIGILTTDEEVGTYLRSMPFLKNTKDEEDFQKKFSDYAKRVSLTRKEFMAGVRDYLQMTKFLEMLDGSALMSDETARLLDMRAQIKLEYDSIVVHASEFDESVKATFDAMDETARDSRITDKYNSIADDDLRFWTKPQWKFEYIFTPFEVEGQDPSVSQKEIEAYYNKNKENYRKPEPEKKEEPKKGKKGKEEEKPEEPAMPEYKPLADVRAEIELELLKQKRSLAAEQRLNTCVKSLLNKQLKQKDDSGEETVRPLSEMAGESFLNKPGIETGVTSEAPAFAEEFVTGLPFGTSADLSGACMRIDQQLYRLDRALQTVKDPEQLAEIKTARENYWKIITTDFIGTPSQKDKSSKPMSSDKGYFKVRLVEFVARVKRPLMAEDGKMDTELRGILVTGLLAEDAKAAADAHAEILRQQLSSGTLGADVKVETKSIAFNEPAASELQTAQLGVAGVRSDAGGLEVYRLTSRDIPASVATDDEVAMQRLRRKNMVRGNMLYAPGVPQGMFGGYISMGPRLTSWVYDRLQDKRIDLLEPLQQHQSNQITY